MMTYLWWYDGELDSAQKVLTLNAEGPSMDGSGKIVKYKDVIEVKSDDHRIMTSQMQGEDGVWREMMRCEYHRTN
jgi:hypothetical protein